MHVDGLPSGAHLPRLPSAVTGTKGAFGAPEGASNEGRSLNIRGRREGRPLAPSSGREGTRGVPLANQRARATTWFEGALVPREFAAATT